MLQDLFMNESLMAGVIPLTMFKGPRRMRKRIAKKILARSRYLPLPLWQTGAAMKTIIRAKNRQARREWAALTEEEKGRRRAQRMLALCMPLGTLMYLQNRRVAPAS